MMGHQSRQMAMIFVDIESLIPETHLLRKIERMVSFDFILSNMDSPTIHSSMHSSVRKEFLLRTTG